MGGMRGFKEADEETTLACRGTSEISLHFIFSHVACLSNIQGPGARKGITHSCSAVPWEIVISFPISEMILKTHIRKAFILLLGHLVLVKCHYGSFRSVAKWHRAQGRVCSDDLVGSPLPRGMLTVHCHRHTSVGVGC